MSVQELEIQVQSLSLDELAQFIHWFEAYRRQVLGEFAAVDMAWSTMRSMTT